MFAPFLYQQLKWLRKSYQNDVRFEQFEEEGKKVSLVFGTIYLATQSYHNAISHYSKYYGGKVWPEPSDRQVLSEGFTLVKFAKKQLVLSNGILQGVQFHNSQLEAYTNQFHEGFQNLEGVLDGIDALYTAYALGDSVSVKDVRQKLQPSVETNDKVGIRLLTAVTGFNEEAVADLNGSKAEIAKATIGLRALYLRLYLGIVALLFVIGYLVAALVTVFGRRLGARPEMP